VQIAKFYLHTFPGYMMRLFRHAILIIALVVIVDQAFSASF